VKSITRNPLASRAKEMVMLEHRYDAATLERWGS
jgi:hypothetical protein